MNRRNARRGKAQRMRRQLRVVAWAVATLTAWLALQPATQHGSRQLGLLLATVTTATLWATRNATPKGRKKK